MNVKFLFALLFISALLSCEKDPRIPYKTRNVVIVVVDGPRWTETWGDPARINIPHRSLLAHEGSFCGEFYNLGETYTVAGHTALVTGNYQTIDNSGGEFPQKHSCFQQWIKKHPEISSEVQLITSKDKLEVLSDCLEEGWQGKYNPDTDCGISGLGSGYREDSITFTNALSVIHQQKTRLLLICFREPDFSAHAGDSVAYINGIRKTDEYVNEIWKALQQNEFYKNKTAFIVTNDHGRHDYEYTGHGDNCNGCRHIEFLAVGPDFKKKYSCSKVYDLTDIVPTVSELLGLKMENLPGEIMWEIFEEPGI